MRFILLAIGLVVSPPAFASKDARVEADVCDDILAATPFTAEQRRQYPVLARSQQDFGTWSYHRYRVSHILPALKIGLVQARKDFKKISQNPAPPTFENTILALNDFDYYLDNIGTFYNMRHGTHRTTDVEAISEEFNSLASKFYTEVSYDPHFFRKLETLYEQMTSGDVKFNKEQRKIIEVMYKNKVKAGLTLDMKKQEQLKKIDIRLSELSLQFGENKQKSESETEFLVTDESKLKGSPQWATDSLREDAEKRKLKGWLISFKNSAWATVLSHAESEDLRRKIYDAYISLASIPGSNHDNSSVVTETARLRHEKARILGYQDYASMKTESQMTKKPETVKAFLNELVERSRPAVAKDLEKLKSFKKKETGDGSLKAWDVGYWSNKMGQKLYDFNPEEFRAYFRYKESLQGAFNHATKMYDLSFEENSNYPTIHRDVDVFEVTDNKTGQTIALLYIDPYQRRTKPSGAWHSALRSQHYQDGQKVIPITQIKMNLPAPNEEGVSRLSLGDVNTIFHEFGHALHSILSDVKYPNLAGTSVAQDFVELPSQLMENFLKHKGSLDLFASHEQTGEKIPQALLDKLEKNENFLKALGVLSSARMSLLDIAWHSEQGAQVTDIEAFETDTVGHTYLLDNNYTTKIASTTFGHIFNGGYASGYYSYLWSELLDADAFQAFLDAGLFTPEFKKVATKFRKTILSRGGTVPEDEMYRNFRGRDLDQTPFLLRKGLLEEQQDSN